ncbi:hypothetical protein V1478_008498 [Vespula squamosa]|uniref:Uncharacterized protein n=1 Tax=Vespula squamosa TaxID=30214 RepID=A0ABD2AVN0_VESSQ
MSYGCKEINIFCKNHSSFHLPGFGILVVLLINRTILDCFSQIALYLKPEVSYHRTILFI